MTNKNKYNTEKYRLIKCSKCKKIINSNIYPIPRCIECNSEMIVHIKSVITNE